MADDPDCTCRVVTDNTGTSREVANPAGSSHVLCKLCCLRQALCLSLSCFIPKVGVKDEMSRMVVWRGGSQ